MQVPYLTLPPGWTGSYTCPALRPYQLGPIRVDAGAFMSKMF